MCVFAGLHWPSCRAACDVTCCGVTPTLKLSFGANKENGRNLDNYTNYVIEKVLKLCRDGQVVLGVQDGRVVDKASG